MVIDVTTWGFEDSSLDESKWYIYGDFIISYIYHPQGTGMSVYDQPFYIYNWYSY